MQIHARAIGARVHGERAADPEPPPAGASQAAEVTSWKRDATAVIASRTHQPDTSLTTEVITGYY